MKNIGIFLKRMGLNDATITKLTGDDEIPEADMTSIVNDHTASLRTTLSNDPTFTDPIKDAITGKERSIIEGVLKKTFGLTAEEVKDKKLADIVTIAHDKAKTMGNASTEDLQKQITQLANEKKQLMEVDLPAAKAEAQTEIKKHKRSTASLAKVSSRQLIIDAAVASPVVDSEFEREFDVDLDDKGNLILFNKGTTVRAMTKDKTRFMEYDEALDGILGRLKFLKQSNGGQGGDGNEGGGGNTKKVETGANTNFRLPGLAAAEQNAKDLGKMKTFSPS